MIGKLAGFALLAIGQPVLAQTDMARATGYQSETPEQLEAEAAQAPLPPQTPPLPEVLPPEPSVVPEPPPEPPGEEEVPLEEELPEEAESAAEPAPRPAPPPVGLPKGPPSVSPPSVRGLFIQTLPPGGAVWLISVFKFNVCKQREPDPWDPLKCGWREVETGIPIDLDGNYVYRVSWPDGTTRRGSRELKRNGSPVVTFRKTGS